MEPADTEHTPAKSEDVLGETLAELRVKSQELLDALQTVGEESTAPQTPELDGLGGFLDILSRTRGTMTDDRLYEAIVNSIRSLWTTCTDLPQDIVEQLAGIEFDEQSQVPEFLVQSIRAVGPSLRVSKEEMSVWITIPPDFGRIYTLETVVSNLRRRGVVFGIDEETIQTLCETGNLGEEVLVATGELPQPGRDGYIEYDSRVKERSLAPKLLESGKASFKDIDTFAFVLPDHLIAKKVPAVPGKAGITVTGQTIEPLEVTEAEFPDCPNTHVSEEGDRLLASIEGCVSLRDGRLTVEPNLHIPGSVSYETGNIDSHVSVLIDEDVPGGFSVQSRKDISVGATVDSGAVEARGSVIVKSGIQGEGQARVEANEDVIAKFITNATVTSQRNVIVETGIVQSTVWAGERVIASGDDSQIVGGTVDADIDVVADIIGSDMGVKTLIRMGERFHKLEQRIEETTQKIRAHEDTAWQCTEVVETLEQRLEEGGSKDPRAEKTLARARKARETAQQNLAKLEEQLQELESQYGESVHRRRTVRARKAILPGTIIRIHEVEFVCTVPTGPATVMPSGDSLSVLPFMELDSEPEAQG